MQDQPNNSHTNNQLRFQTLDSYRVAKEQAQVIQALAVRLKAMLWRLQH